MKKTFYIIPGWEDTCDDKQYQMLGASVEKLGYEVVYKNVNWKKDLSTQLFTIPNDSVVFGFSLGAILAWLVAQKHPCKLLILASMTPHYSFTDITIKKALADLVGEDFVFDIVKNLKPKTLAQKHCIFYGDKEGKKADVLVKDTDHEITKNYIDEVIRILE